MRAKIEATYRCVGCGDPYTITRPFTFAPGMVMPPIPEMDKRSEGCCTDLGNRWRLSQVKFVVKEMENV